MAHLQRERRFFARKPELLRFGPYRGNLCGRPSRPHQLDRRVEIVAAPLVGVVHRVGRGADRETAVVARAIAHVGVEDVVVHRIAGPEHPVREHVRVRAAAFAGDGVHAFHVLRSEVVEPFGDEPDRFVLAHARLHRFVEVVVRRVDHRRGVSQQRDFVLRLDLAGVRHQLLTVDDRRDLLSAARTGSAARQRPRRPAPCAGRAFRARSGSSWRPLQRVPSRATSRRASRGSRRATARRASRN